MLLSDANLVGPFTGLVILSIKNWNTETHIEPSRFGGNTVQVDF
jgi:hypothetical protein